VSVPRPRPLTRRRLDRALTAIDRHDPALRSFIELDRDGAAQAIGRGGAARGLLVGVKANIAVRGLATSAGSAARRTAIADSDATAVRRLRDAGAGVLGTLNMHEGALGATTANETFGFATNPWRAGHTPGGSSGGSGAAVAAGLVDAALGTDTMGSVRLPAAYCGVYGLRPSGVWLVQDGCVPLAPSLDQIGPFARDAPTLVRMVRALGGPRPRRLDGARFGRITDHDTIPADMQELLDRAQHTLEAQGASVVPIALDLGISAASLLKAGLLVCESEGAKVWADELERADSGLSAGFRALLTFGRRADAGRIDEARAVLAQARERIRSCLSAARLDGLICPTATETAFAHGAAIPVQAQWTVLASVADLPAVSCPAGLRDGLPLGVQVIGAPAADALVLGAALALPSPLPRPPLFIEN
jgi:aspartyl-tRNA(Asn)/glutamyl-tRNA(Gln) amidotransferase subunit A